MNRSRRIAVTLAGALVACGCRSTPKPALAELPWLGPGSDAWHLAASPADHRQGIEPSSPRQQVAAAESGADANPSSSAPAVPSNPAAPPAPVTAAASSLESVAATAAPPPPAASQTADKPVGSAPATTTNAAISSSLTGPGRSSALTNTAAQGPTAVAVPLRSAAGSNAHGQREHEPIRFPSQAAGTAPTGSKPTSTGLTTQDAAPGSSAGANRVSLTGSPAVANPTRSSTNLSLAAGQPQFGAGQGNAAPSRFGVDPSAAAAATGGAVPTALRLGSSRSPGAAASLGGHNASPGADAVTGRRPVSVRSEIHLVAAGDVAVARAALVARLKAGPGAVCAVVVPGQKQPVLLTAAQALQQLADLASPLRAILLPAEGEDPLAWAQSVTLFESVPALEKMLGQAEAEARWRQAQLERQTATRQAAEQQRDSVHDTLQRWLAPRRQ